MIFVATAVASHMGRSGLGGGVIISLSAVGSLTGPLLAPRGPRAACGPAG